MAHNQPLRQPTTREERLALLDKKYTTEGWWHLLGSSRLNRWGPIVTACGGQFSTSHAYYGGAYLNPHFAGSGLKSWDNHMNLAAMPAMP